MARTAVDIAEEVLKFIVDCGYAKPDPNRTHFEIVMNYSDWETVRLSTNRESDDLRPLNLWGADLRAESHVKPGQYILCSGEASKG